MWIDLPLVNEVKMPSKRTISWHDNDAEEGELARDPALVLLNLSTQTGLEFNEEKRKVETLFVERDPSE